MLEFVRNIRWKLVGYACLSGLAIVGVMMLMALVKKKDVVQECVSLKVMVEGKETFINQEDISDLIKVGFGEVVGKPLIEIPTAKIEKTLAELPYVSSAEIYADMDGVLQVAVKQREVVLRIINARGQEYYIDTKGAKIPVTLKYVPHVLIANGYIKEGYGEALDTVETDVVRSLIKIATHVKDDVLWGNQIVQLYVNGEQDIEIVPRVGSQQLIVGSAENIEDKLTRLEAFYKNILPRVGSDAYARVNVKYEDQIICERQKGWFLDSLQMKIN